MEILVNHLTRMREGFMCAAGVECGSDRHVRPINYSQLAITHLARYGGAFDIGNVVKLTDTRPYGVRPHLEDHLFDEASATCVRVAGADEFWSMLSGCARSSLREIFGDDLTARGPSCVVEEFAGKASLGCLTPSGPIDIYQKPRARQPNQVRIRFSDGEFNVDLGLTDIRLYGRDHVTPDPKKLAIAAESLKRGDPVILSVGLSRAYPVSAPVHWLQANNIHFGSNPLWQLE
jgi:hypothetical protein